MSTIYIHWPFCISKCHYCDFNSVARNGEPNHEMWFKKYINVLTRFKNDFYKNELITSVYFGGGTPSLIPSWFVEQLIDEIAIEFRLSTDAEITLEANPKTIDRQKALELRAAGVNRISIGVQSLVDSDLKILGRIHSATEAKDCVFTMAEIFSNISLDMIYNRPGQNIDSWEVELNEVLAFPISHASLYELIVEPGTRMEAMINSGIVPPPSDSSNFFEETMSITKEHGFEMYEVSNFAKNKNYGRHNLSYWKYEDYYGIGPGAHSRVSVNGRKLAIAQIANNTDWLNWAENPVFTMEDLSEEDQAKERLIMGLRSTCGVNLNDFSDHVKSKCNIWKKINKLQQNSYIMRNGENVVLTRNGIMKLNLIIQYLVEGL